MAESEINLYKRILHEIIHSVGSDGIKNENYSQIFKLLRNAFNVDNEQHNELVKQAQDNKQPPSQIVLRLEICEAKDLKTKRDANNICNPFCEFQIDNETFVTNIKEKTLQPTWNEVFEISLDRIVKDEIKIHICDCNTAQMKEIEKLSEGKIEDESIKDEIKQFLQSRKKYIRRIGKVKIQTKALPARGLVNWYSLKKNKIIKVPRGQLHVGVSLSSLSTNLPEESCKSMINLLEILLNYHLAVHKVTINLWRGNFTIEEEQILTQHAIQSRVLPHQENLAKLIAYCNVHTKHRLNFQAFALPLSEIVEINVYNSTELSLFWNSVPLVLCDALTLLTTLENVSLEDSEATFYLKAALSIIRSMISLNSSRDIDILPINLCPWRDNTDDHYTVQSALEDAVRIGIERRFLRLQPSVDPNKCGWKQAIKNMNGFIDNIICEMLGKAEWTDEIFKMTSQVSYLKTVAAIIDEKASCLIRDLVKSSGEQLKTYQHEEILTSKLPTEIGNELFTLYHQVQKLGCQLHLLLPGSSLHIKERFAWFGSFITPRLEIAIIEARQLIKRFVKEDNLEPITDTSKITASAIEAVQYVSPIKTFLTELEWPDCTELGNSTINLITGICDCLIEFADEMIHQCTSKASNDFKKCCNAINGIESVRKYLPTILHDLNLEGLCADLINCGQEANSIVLMNSYNKVEETQKKLNDQIDEIVDKIIIQEVEKITSAYLVTATREQKKETKSSFFDCMSQNLTNLNENLCEEHKERVFQKVINLAWFKIVKHFEQEVEIKIKDNALPSSFKVLKSKLEELQEFFFTDTDNVGTNIASQRTADDELSIEVLKKLRLHSMSTNELIMVYYISRFHEQNNPNQETYGQISIIAYFKDQKIVVTILNARGVKYENSTDNCKLYVKLKLLLSNPQRRNLKTDKQTLYQETMTFGKKFQIMLNSNQREPNAMLQVKLMEHRFCSRNKFVGEAFVLFSSLPENEHEDQMHLMLRRPDESTESEVLKTLKNRCRDADACKFVVQERRKTTNGRSESCFCF